MSSETFTPASATPSDPPLITAGGTPNTPPRRSGLASFIAPVAPVRTAPQDADETDGQDAVDGDEETVTDGSSTSFKDGNGDDNSSSGTSSNSQSKSVVRAWLLAGAQRWAKGGGTANKRLDVKKMRAQARQVKTAETVNVKRTEGPGLLSSSGGAGQKPKPASKSQTGGGRQSNGSSGGGRSKSPAGPSGAGNRGRNSADKPSGRPNGSGSGGGLKKTNNRGATDKGLDKPRTKNNATSDINKTPKTTKTPGGKTGDRPWRKDQTPNSKTNKGAGGGTAPKGPRTKGPDAPNRKQPADLTKDKTPKTNPKAPTGKAGRDEKPKRPWHRTPQTPKNTKGPEDLNTPKLPGKPDLKKQQAPKTDDSKGPVKPARKLIDLVKRPKRDPKAPTGDAAVDSKTQPKQQDPKKPKTPTGPHLRTQKARETGYRHGTAVGEVAAQAGAYRDGVLDGIKARTEQGDREKARMDDIHARRKKQHQEKTMTTAATSADYHPAQKAPTPIPATLKDDGKVHLGAGAALPTMSGGEVRNMKQFQDKLNDKAYALTWVSEDLKAKNTQVAQVAKRVSELREKGRALAVGDKSIGKATKAAEAVSKLAAEVDALLTITMRGIDEVTTLNSNTQTRYGQIYKAVVDSDEQAPANNLGYYVNQGA
ncbi:hypothetical protein [Streptomyces sp. NPDC056982]|uniref:hypothetical protein n=1 Tax=Streptomyces sp. NPDC056982 TaxID=3345986 RepID=UPI0036413C38